MPTIATPEEQVIQLKPYGLVLEFGFHPNDKVRDYLPYSTPLEGRTLGQTTLTPKPTQNRHRSPLASTEHIIIPVVRDLFYGYPNLLHHKLRIMQSII